MYHTASYTPQLQNGLGDKSFQAMKQIVDNLQVVNEAAERGVKLCHDFIGHQG